MVLTESNAIEIGSLCPDFNLKSTDGESVSRETILASIEDGSCRGVLVAFICNHCPYVIHIADVFSKMALAWQKQGIQVLGICSNDPIKYPADNFENMILEKSKRGYAFPYLHDPKQTAARDFNAACTPEFFLYDNALKLVYCGRFDGSRPGSETPVDGDSLDSAVRLMLAGKQREIDSFASMGCNIKWLQ